MIAWAEVLGSILNTNNNSAKFIQKKDMESERIVKDYEKVDTEEVNVYTNDCGITRKECVTDCIGGNALITPME